MTYGRVSPKYQIVIPKEVREKTAIRPGQRLMIYTKDNLIILVPEVAVSQLKGICKGMDTSDIRDEDDKL